MSTKTPEQAAGGLVWRRRSTGIEVLIVHRPGYDDWGFPKGKLDPGESLIECARREVLEETGLHTAVGRFLRTTRYPKPSGRMKEVTYWAMERTKGAFHPNSEIDDIAWVPADKLVNRLTYGLDRQMIDELAPDWTGVADRILLVRHAHAGDRQKWKGDDDRIRPLSKKGARQAKAIRKQLTGFAFDTIVSSPALRCLETVEPIADKRGLAVLSTESLWETASPADIESALAAAGGTSRLLCTHGPVIARALGQLIGPQRLMPMEKSSTWVLDFTSGNLAAANYMAPPS